MTSWHQSAWGRGKYDIMIAPWYHHDIMMASWHHDIMTSWHQSAWGRGKYVIMIASWYHHDIMMTSWHQSACGRGKHDIMILSWHHHNIMTSGCLGKGRIWLWAQGGRGGEGGSRSRWGGICVGVWGSRGRGEGVVKDVFEDPDLMAGSRTKGTRKRKPKTQTMQRVPRNKLKRKLIIRLSIEFIKLFQLNYNLLTKLCSLIKSITKIPHTGDKESLDRCG